MSSILSFSHYTTKYNIEQLFSAGHPLNISLFSNKDRTSASFVAVTSCDGRGWSAHYRRETETQQKLVRLCWLRVDVACCVCCHCKINIGRSKWKKKKSRKFVEFRLKCLPKGGWFQVNFMDCWCGTMNLDENIEGKNSRLIGNFLVQNTQRLDAEHSRTRTEQFTPQKLCFCNYFKGIRTTQGRSKHLYLPS